MIRIFGLIVALAALMAPAQAALLRYDFTNTAVGVLNPSSIGSATSFTGGGSVGPTLWTTAALGSPNTNTFSFTAAAPGAYLEDFHMSARRNPTGATNTAKVDVYYNVGAVSTGTSGELLTSSTLSSTLNLISGDLGFNLFAGETIHFTIVSSRSSTGTPTASFDFLQIDGSAIPEPTSMAVFGLLGAGIAARRIRRKA